MTSYIQEQLFPSLVPRLEWQYAAQLKHYSNGNEVLQVMRIVNDPFRTTTFHVQEFGARFQAEHGLLGRWVTAMDLAAGCQEIRMLMNAARREES